ncbi:MAG: hypothetical protein CL947_03670 [Epsilonproteobacteria bacterium]|nr:hypothetical protein [Campylobacterota bacterium]
MNVFKFISKYIKTLFINGLIFLLPITITFALFSFFFNLVKSWLIPLRKLNIPLLEAIPHHEILLIIIFILLIGALLRFFILRPLVQFVEDILSRLPLIRTVYSGVKQLVSAFTSQDQLSFKKVVVIEFPIKGAYSIGFLTSQVPHQIAPDTEKIYVNIYIPTTPNPTTGFFVMVPEGTYMETDLTRQEATALIISGGILQPERYVKKQDVK